MCVAINFFQDFKQWAASVLGRRSPLRENNKRRRFRAVAARRGSQHTGSLLNQNRLENIALSRL